MKPAPVHATLHAARDEHLLDRRDGVLACDADEGVDVRAHLVDKAGALGNIGRLGSLLLLGVLLALLDLDLLLKGLGGEGLGLRRVVADVDVVKEDVFVHGPELEANTADGVEVGGAVVLKEVGVGDLARGPDALVVGVVDERRGPLALVGRVALHGTHPLAAAGGGLALGVGDAGSEPLAVLLVVPLLGLLCVRVGHGERLGLEPAVRHGGLVVGDYLESTIVDVVVHHLDGIVGFAEESRSRW